MRKVKYILLAMTVGLLLSCGKQEQVSSFEEAGEIIVNDYKKYKIEKLFSVDGITVYRFKDGIKYVYFTKNNTYYIKNGTKRIGKTVYHTEEIIQSINTEEPDTLNINGLDYIKCDK